MSHNYTEEAIRAAQMLGLNLSQELFSVQDLARGLEVEYEHGRVSPETNVTNDDLLSTAKIALAHLREYPDYYARLSIAEKPALMSVGKFVAVLVVLSVLILVVHFFQDHLGKAVIGDYTYHQILVSLVFFWAIVGYFVYKK